MKRLPRGFTLIELLVAMSLFGTIMTIVAVSLGHLARADHNTRDRIDRQRSLQQFIVRLRQDIHEASSATISSGQVPPGDGNNAADPPTPRQTLTLLLQDGRSIRFQPTSDGIERTVTADGTEQHRESYSWGSPSDATWAIDTTHELPIAILTLVIERGHASGTEQYVIQTTLLNSEPNNNE